ncbi:hypothetical protein P3T36_007837 [Kitasatospora sp. MAP12-15]|uniref:ML domain-containing protein n=1 Tax=unclassified Kitasatospora TaxID=2633591 RepID=UPI002473427E|nr:ML domain-containing protein [Kitasatospora sp. MAP12-44]MDH6115501.1 hypothetical protein [Kitasatospora sp. MAP12-44]
MASYQVNDPSGTNLMEVINDVLTPDPPVKGADLRIAISGKLRKVPASGAKVDTLLKYGMIAIAKQSDDWAQLFAGSTAPTAPGPVTFAVTLPCPSDSPSGKYAYSLTATSGDDVIVDLTGAFLLS